MGGVRGGAARAARHQLGRRLLVAFAAAASPSARSSAPRSSSSVVRRLFTRAARDPARRDDRRRAGPARSPQFVLPQPEFVQRVPDAVRLHVGARGDVIVAEPAHRRDRRHPAAHRRARAASSTARSTGSRSAPRPPTPTRRASRASASRGCRRSCGCSPGASSAVATIAVGAADHEQLGRGRSRSGPGCCSGCSPPRSSAGWSSMPWACSPGVAIGVGEAVALLQLPEPARDPRRRPARRRAPRAAPARAPGPPTGDDELGVGRSRRGSGRSPPSSSIAGGCGGCRTLVGLVLVARRARSRS